MKKSIMFSFLILSCITTFSAETKSGNKTWNLVWSEEFNGSSLDKTKWQYQIGNGFWNGDTWISGWGNNESEYYTDREKNVAVKDGKLIITAQNDNFDGEAGGKKVNFPYTSGKIYTKDLYAKKYGRIEFRAKLPRGKGLWPALWLLPQKDIYGGWAASGEIDVVEGWGSNDKKLAGTLHYGETWPKNTHTGKEYVFKNSSVTEFHDYVLEWLPGEIKWYVDGELYQVQNNWYAKHNNEAMSYTYPAPFDQEFYIILNLAVGGWFDGDINESTKFPATMEVDYVRVYDLEGGYDENVKKPEIKANENSTMKQKVNENLLDNGDFSNEDKSWQLLSHFGGQGTFSFEKEDNEELLKATIDDGGQQSYSIQIIHDVPLVKGQWYKLTFDAKAELPREIGLKIGAGEQRGWIPYYTSAFNLTKSLDTYTAIFQMNGDTDPIAKLEIHGGLSKTNFSLGNFKLAPIDNVEEEFKNILKMPLGNGNLIYNGTFDQGDLKRTIFWEFEKINSDILVKNRQLSIAGKNELVRVYQKRIPLTKGANYSMSFKAASDVENKLVIKVMDKDLKNTFLEKEFLLSKDLKSYDFNFKSEFNDKEYTIVAELPNATDNITLDDFFLKKQTDYSGIEKVIVNDDFSTKDSLRNWTLWKGGEYGFGGDSTITVDKSRAKFTIKDIGNEEWSNLLYQNITLQKGLKYRVSFDINSSITRDVRLVVENANYQKYVGKLINVDKNVKNISVDFVAERAEEVGVKFIVGNVGSTKNRPHDIYIDNVKVEVVEE